MQKRVRVIKTDGNGKNVVFGIAIQKEIALFASGVYYEAKWQSGNILLVSGTNAKPDDKLVESYEFQNCRVGENAN